MSDTQLPTIAVNAATQSLSTRTERDPPTDLPPVPEVPGYEIIRVVGRGGMGIVYEARDTQLQRTVALKMILMGPHASQKDRVRFRQEAEAVARLQHPGIVQIFEVGESSTGPFLVLEFVAGGSLSERLDGKPWLALDSAQLIEQLADAVEAAHRSGVIHRDLKPANVLLSVDSGQWAVGSQKEEDRSSDRLPTARSPLPTAKIADFGLAKRIDSDQGNTASGAILGTPSYMAPEQAEGKSSSIGPATDVYALGAILYELLTGRPPFVAETPFDTIVQVSRQEPVPPSRLNAKVPRDLETICLKCLRKEPERRYSSSAALAEDLRRFREKRPILARPVGPIERGWRWCRRNPALAASLLSVVVALIAGINVATYFAFAAERGERDAKASAAAAKTSADEAKKSADEANDAKNRGESTVYAAHINLSQNSLRENRLIRLRELLDETSEEHRSWEWHFLRRQASMHLPGLKITESPTDLEHPGCVDLSSNAGGTRIAAIVSVENATGRTAPIEYECRVLDGKSGKVLFAKQLERMNLLSFIGCSLSADGKHVAAGSGTNLVIWEVDTGRQRKAMTVAYTNSYSFDATGELLAFNEAGTIKIMRINSGKVEHAIPYANSAIYVPQLEFSGDGQTLYAIRSEQQPGRANSFHVVVYDLSKKKVRFTAGPYREDDGSPMFTLSGNGRWLAVHSGKQSIAIWNTVQARLLNPVTVTNKVGTLAFSHDGRYLAIGAPNGLITVHDRFVDAAAPPILFRGHEAAVWFMKFSTPAQIVTVSSDGVLRTWNLGRPEPHRLIPGWSSPVNSSVFEPAFDRNGTTVAQIVTMPGNLIGGMHRRTLKVWDASTGKVLLQLSLGQVPANSEASLQPLGKIALSADGRQVAFVLFEQEDLDAIRKAAGFVPGVFGRLGGVSGYGGGAKAVVDAGMRAWLPQSDLVQIYDVEKAKRIASFPHEGDMANDMSFSPDGKLLQIAGYHWRLHEAATGRCVAFKQGEDGINKCSSIFHPNGNWLAIADSWMLLRGEFGLASGPVPEARGHETIELKPIDLKSESVKVPLTEDEEKLHIARLVFSPTGKYLAATCVGPNRIRGTGGKTELPMRLILWRCEPNGVVTRTLSVSFGTMMPALMTEPMAVAFNRDETLIAAGALAGQDQAELRIWEIESGRQRHSFRVQASGVEFLDFTPDGRRLIAAGGTRSGTDMNTAEAHVWDLTTGEELLEIPLGGVLSSTGARTSAYHFDGLKLRAAGWNDKGGELRVLDGTPVGNAP